MNVRWRWTPERACGAGFALLAIALVVHAFVLTARDRDTRHFARGDRFVVVNDGHFRMFLTEERFQETVRLIARGGVPDMLDESTSGAVRYLRAGDRYAIVSRLPGGHKIVVLSGDSADRTGWLLDYVARGAEALPAN